MKVAIAGKGGSGKTTVAGTMARLAARRGADVLAVDADLNPNLALTLGLGAGAFDGILPLPHDLVAHRRAGGAMDSALIKPVEEVVLEYGVVCPDEVRLLLMGRPHRAGTGCMCSEHATVHGVLHDLPGDRRLVLVDMEASPEHLTRSTPEAADAVLLVAEPYFRSLETARRYAALAHDLGIPRVAMVGNKMRDAEDRQALEAFCETHGIELFGAVPYDHSLASAERARVAPVDHSPEPLSVGAVAGLVSRVLDH